MIKRCENKHSEVRHKMHLNKSSLWVWKPFLLSLFSLLLLLFNYFSFNVLYWAVKSIFCYNRGIRMVHMKWNKQFPPPPKGKCCHCNKEMAVAIRCWRYFPHFGKYLTSIAENLEVWSQIRGRLAGPTTNPYLKDELLACFILFICSHPKTKAYLLTCWETHTA